MKNKKINSCVLIMLLTLGLDSILISESFSTVQDQNVIQQVDTIIQQAFASVDSYAEKGYWRSSPEAYTYKIQDITNKINEAFDNLANQMQTSPESMQPIKETFSRAIEFFAEQSPNNASHWLPKIVDAAKYLMKGPVQVAILTTGSAIGSVTGALGGAAEGVTITGRKINNLVGGVSRRNEGLKHQQFDSLSRAAQLSEFVIVEAVSIVVQAPIILAYKTAENAYRGARVGYDVAKNQTGNIALRDTQNQKIIPEVQDVTSQERFSSSSDQIYSTDDPNESSWLDSSIDSSTESLLDKQGIESQNANKQPVSAAQEESLTLRAQQLITQAFDAMDTWIETPLIIPDSSVPNLRGSLNNTLYSPNDLRLINGTINRDADLKISVVLKQIDTVFASLEKSMKGSSLQPMQDAALTANASSLQQMKDAVLKAVKTFSEESTIKSPILKGIVDSAKTALIAPVKLAVKVTTTAIGAGVGGIGNTAASLGAGMNRTAKRISKTNSEVLNSENNIMVKAVKVFVYTTCITLDGIVDTAILAAYAAQEGVVLGAAGGIVAGNKIAGDVVRLDKPKIQMQLKKDAKKRQGVANNDTTESKDVKSNKVVFKNELVEPIVFGESGSDSLQEKRLQVNQVNKENAAGIHQSEQLLKFDSVSPQQETAATNNKNTPDVNIWENGEKYWSQQVFSAKNSSEPAYKDSHFDVQVGNVNSPSGVSSPRGVASPALSRSNSSDNLQITNSAQSDAQPTEQNKPDLSIELHNGPKPTGYVYQDPRLASQQNSSPARVDTESANPSDFIDLTQPGVSPNNVSSANPISNFFGGINTGQPESNFEVHTVPDTRDPLSQYVLPGSNVDISKEQYIPESEILKKQSYLQQIKDYFNKPKPVIRVESGRF
jgi:hypothetical protein